MMTERSKTLQLMDRLEEIVLKGGWPVPLTPYYLVHHEEMIAVLDELRVSLQDEMDERFIKAFATPPQSELQSSSQQKSVKGE